MIAVANGNLREKGGSQKMNEDERNLDIKISQKKL